MKLIEIVDVERSLGTNPNTTAKRPQKYYVMLNNEDYTPGEVVALVLQEVFGLTGDLAFNAMMSAHKHGHAIIGTFSRDIAETKAHTAVQKARELTAHFSKAFGVDADLEPTSMLFTVEPAE